LVQCYSRCNFQYLRHAFIQTNRRSGQSKVQMVNSLTKSQRLMIVHVAIGVAFTLIGLAGLDGVTAEYLRASGYEGLRMFNRGTVFLDIVTGKEISKFLIGLVLVSSALVLMIPSKTKLISWSVLFVGVVQLLGTLVTGVSKNFFGRLRPYELLKSGDWGTEWFVDGNSFPSGHAGFYFGLFLPLAFLFPRWRWPLLIVPWFIAIARVNANDHFISDVAASIAIVGGLTLLVAWLMRRRVGRSG
jgi:membrane-associated phospholipid phosphatase